MDTEKRIAELERLDVATREAYNANLLELRCTMQRLAFNRMVLRSALMLLARYAKDEPPMGTWLAAQFVETYKDLGEF